MSLIDRLTRALRTSPERRKHERLGVGAPTMVVLPGQPSGVRAFIRDISKGGCLLDADADVPVGARVSLAFLSKACGHCRAMGCVVRTAGDHAYGVEFSQVNMAFLGFVGSVGSSSPQARSELVAAMKGSTVEITAAPP
jgi:hypothetical protein